MAGITQDDGVQDLVESFVELPASGVSAATQAMIDDNEAFVENCEAYYDGLAATNAITCADLGPTGPSSDEVTCDDLGPTGPSPDEITCADLGPTGPSPDEVTCAERPIEVGVPATPTAGGPEGDSVTKGEHTVTAGEPVSASINSVDGIDGVMDVFVSAMGIDGIDGVKDVHVSAVNVDGAEEAADKPATTMPKKPTVNLTQWTAKVKDQLAACEAIMSNTASDTQRRLDIAAIIQQLLQTMENICVRYLRVYTHLLQPLTKYSSLRVLLEKVTTRVYSTIQQTLVAAVSSAHAGRPQLLRFKAMCAEIPLDNSVLVCYTLSALTRLARSIAHSDEPQKLAVSLMLKFVSKLGRTTHGDVFDHIVLLLSTIKSLKLKEVHMKLDQPALYSRLKRMYLIKGPSTIKPAKFLAGVASRIDRLARPTKFNLKPGMQRWLDKNVPKYQHDHACMVQAELLGMLIDTDYVTSRAEYIEDVFISCVSLLESGSMPKVMLPKVARLLQRATSSVTLQREEQFMPKALEFIVMHGLMNIREWTTPTIRAELKTWITGQDPRSTVGLLLKEIL